MDDVHEVLGEIVKGTWIMGVAGNSWKNSPFVLQFWLQNKIPLRDALILHSTIGSTSTQLLFDNDKSAMIGNWGVDVPCYLLVGGLMRPNV